MEDFEFVEIKSAVKVAAKYNLTDIFDGYVLLPRGWEATAKSEIPVPNGYDNAYSQGSEFEIWVVLKYGGRFFKFTGEMDSYGEKTMSHLGIEVQAVEKKVTVYEFE